MDSATEKEQLTAELDGASASGPAPDTIRKYLKLVVLHSLCLLSKGESVIGVWLFYEQVAIACMDIQAHSCARSCVKAVNTEFPKSIRANRLRVCELLFLKLGVDSIDELSRAETVYDDILSQDPSNEIILKRKVAICKTRGDLVAAAQTLNSYLDSFMMDRDAWEELAEIYLKMQMYKQAAHCYEELLLLAPSHLTYHLRYADTLYTIGTVQDIATAQSYYAHALEVSQGTSIRALYGVCLCTSHPKTRKSSGEEDETLGSLSAKALVKLYTEADSPLLPSVKSILRSQGLLD